MIDFTKIKIMGVLNTTPDSFSDGKKYINTKNAIKHSQHLLKNGADIIDIGGESSRPNADFVSENEELSRIIPAIKAIKNNAINTFISVDTYKPKVMEQVLNLGVNMINDIYALQQVEAENMAEILSVSDCDICLMHMQNNPKNMQKSPKYKDIISEIKYFFECRIRYAEDNNINTKRLILDPGFGFGKTYDHNIIILKNLIEFQEFGLKILVGLSKKSMFDTILKGRDPSGRVLASTIAAGIAIENGADIIRTHNPLEVSDMLKVMQSLKN